MFRVFTALLALWMLLAASTESRAAVTDNLYALRGAPTNNIYQIDPVAGIETVVYTGYPGGSAATLAMRPSDGMLFYVINAVNGVLYSWDPATPASAPVPIGTGIGAAVPGGLRMTFAQDGTLYFMTGNDLYTIDQVTGVAALAATITGSGTGGDIAIGPDGAFYIINNTQLYTAPLAGGAATLVGAVTGVTGNIIALGFDRSARMVIAASDAASSAYYYLDPTTLAATLIVAATGGTATGDLAAAPAQLIAGTVYEDVDYGGGAGRSLLASAGTGRSGARLELYDGTGSFVIATTTNASGAYRLAGAAGHSYVVRAVSSTVSSSRTGYVAGLLPVQTFRTDASGGSVVAVTNYVGGQVPTQADASAGASGTVMNTATGAFTAGIAGQAQSITTTALGTSVGGALNGVDFGFNFDTIVNTSDSGQGSVRQFIANSNALANTGLAQSGQTAGKETTIFMLADGNAHPGVRAGLASQLTGGVALITPASAYAAISAADTVIDGTTQTSNIGNTNALSLGTGGTVGVDSVALPQVAGPEVQFVGNRSFGLFDFAAGADSGVVRGIAAYGFTIEIRVQAPGILIEHNVLGTSATSFADPGGGVRSSSNHVQAPTPPAAANGTIRENLIAYGGATGNAVYAAGWTIRNNEIRSNGREAATDDGIAMHGGAGTASILENLITSNAGFGIDLMANAGGNTIRNNTITGNGHGNGTPTQRGGIRLMGWGSSIDRNVFTAQNGSGIHVSGTDAANPAYTPAIRNTITHNSFSGDGLIGIDLLAAGASTPVGDGVTLNDGGMNPTTGNQGLDYPVLTSAQYGGSTLRVQGTVTAGAHVEFYKSDNDPSGYGEGASWLTSLVEGSASDNDAAAGSFDFTFAVSGIALGDRITSIALLEPDAGGFPGQYNTSEFSANATTVTDLEIVKRAFQADGTPIASGTTLPQGLTFRYVLYVNNRNGARTDVSLRDVLDPAFAYQAGTLRVDNSVAACAALTCTAPEEANIYAAVSAAALRTDAVNGDVASYAAGTRTIDAGNQNVGNAQLDVNANRVWALLFSVRMQ